MTLFKNKSFEKKTITFNKDQIIREILNQRSEKFQGWNFFRISKDIIVWEYQKQIENFDILTCDFLAIYTDMISERITIKGNPFSEFQKIVENPYQIVIEVFITEETDVDTYEHNNGNPQIYKKITAGSARELFVKLKNELKKE